jgi:hypothetical protein
MKRVKFALLAASTLLALAFMFSSCASKAQAVDSSQDELRVKKDDMMKKLDEGTAASQDKN